MDLRGKNQFRHKRPIVKGRQDVEEQETVPSTSKTSTQQGSTRIQRQGQNVPAKEYSETESSDSSEEDAEIEAVSPAESSDEEDHVYRIEEVNICIRLTLNS